jgi:hypothetical protein
MAENYLIFDEANGELFGTCHSVMGGRRKAALMWGDEADDGWTRVRWEALSEGGAMLTPPERDEPHEGVPAALIILPPNHPSIIHRTALAAPDGD